VAPVGWINEARLLARARAHLESALGAEVLAASCQQGAQLDDKAGLTLLETVLTTKR
jgi:hypothetical protein